MFKKIIKAVLKMFWYLIFGGTAIVILARTITGLYGSTKTYTEADVPARRVAIIFGAGLWRDGSPTPVLRDRVQRGANLYFAGKVEKLLMSGDNSLVEYNEPAAMHEYALSLGVPESAIVLDYAGRRTYDTCYRAKEIFGVKEAILITQKFHLPRAIFLCNALGVDGVGVDADLRTYQKRSLLFWNIRELPATVTAFADILIRPQPILGEPEPIFPNQAQ